MPGRDADVDIAMRLADDFSTGGFDYFYQLEQLQKPTCRGCSAARWTCCQSRLGDSACNMQ
jgi:hypothetical protein